MQMRIKKILLSFLLLVVGLPLSAQVVWGVRAGGAYSSLIQKIDGVSESGSRFGYTAAGILEIPLHKRLSLRPEVAFTSQGGRYSVLQKQTTQYTDRECNYYSVQIPVNIQFIFTTPEIMFGLFGGPYIDCSLWGKVRENGISRDLNLGSGYKNDLKPFDMGVNLGLNVEYNSFFFSVQSFCGVLNRNSSRQPGESPMFQNNATFSLGYMFR